jgi:hypothetical protein
MRANLEHRKAPDHYKASRRRRRPKTQTFLGSKGCAALPERIQEYLYRPQRVSNNLLNCAQIVRGSSAVRLALLF